MKILVPCGIRIAHANPADAWGHIHDISVGGVELHSYFPFTRGQTLFLTFSIDEMYSFVNTKSTVVRIRSEEGYVFLGVSFDELVDKEHIRDALQSLLDKE